MKNPIHICLIQYLILIGFTMSSLTITSSNKSKTWLFYKLIFPSAISEWNQLNFTIRNLASLNTFKKKILNLIRPCESIIFHIHNPLGIKLLTRFRLDLRHLHEHKIRRCFQDTLNLLRESGKYIESTMYFFLYCTNFLIPRKTLFHKINNIDDTILSQSKKQLTQTLLYGNQNYHSSINRFVRNSTIEYLISTERFKSSLSN